MAIFDPNTFLDQEIGKEMSEERQLIPADTYPLASIKELKPVEGVTSEGKPWAKMNFIWSIEDPELQRELDRRELLVTQGVMLDLTPDGELDTGKGKNWRLGKLRAALGINEAGNNWSKFLNKQAQITVIHRMVNGTPMEDVSDVAARD